jgi:hypothetical protein
MNITEFVGAEETENVDQEVHRGLNFFSFLRWGETESTWYVGH